MPGKSLFFSLLLFLLAIPKPGQAQDIPIYTQFFTNPYIYNPAYAGVEGRSIFTLTHRRQWISIDEAPVSTNFVYSTPVVLGFNVGANINQDEAGIFKRTSGLITFGYSVDFGWNHYLNFGISGGANFNNINLSEGVNINDPALAGVLEKNTSLAGNAGIAYHISNFNVGFTLPKLFKTATYGKDDFDTGEFDATSNIIINMDYMIYISQGQNAVIPYVLYRSYQGYPTQFEGGAIYQYQNIFWAGAGYRQDFGYMALLGLKLNNGLSIGYSFEYPANAVTGINNTSHEIQISFVIGESIKRRSNYATFLDNTIGSKPEKPKEEEPPKESRPRFEKEFDD